MTADNDATIDALLVVIAIGAIGGSGAGIHADIDVDSLATIGSLAGAVTTLDTTGSISLLATATQSSTAHVGGGAGGLGAVTWLIADPTITGSTSATIVGRTTIVRAAGVDVTARLLGAASTSEVVVGTGGALSIGGSQAYATTDPDVSAFIGNDVTVGNLANPSAPVPILGGVTVSASAKAEADSTADSYGGGGIQVGIPLATTTITPSVTAFIGLPGTGSSTRIYTGGSIRVAADLSNTPSVALSDKITAVDITKNTLTFSYPGIGEGDSVSYQASGTGIQGLHEGRTYTVLDTGTTGAIRLGSLFSGAQVDPLTEIITFGTAHGFVSGDCVVYDPRRQLDPRQRGVGDRVVQCGGAPRLLCAGDRRLPHQAHDDPRRRNRHERGDAEPGRQREPPRELDPRLAAERDGSRLPRTRRLDLHRGRCRHHSRPGDRPGVGQPGVGAAEHDPYRQHGDNRDRHRLHRLAPDARAARRHAAVPAATVRGSPARVREAVEAPRRPGRRRTASTRSPRSAGRRGCARYGGRISSEWEFAKALQLLEEDPEVYAATDRWVEARRLDHLAAVRRRDPQHLHRRLQGYPPGRPVPLARLPGGAEPALRRLRRRQARAPAGRPRRPRRRPHRARRPAGPACPTGIAVAVGNVDAHVTAPAARADRARPDARRDGHVDLPRDERRPARRGARHVRRRRRRHRRPGCTATRPGRAASATSSAGSSTTRCRRATPTRRASAGWIVHEHLTELAAAQAVGEHGLVALDWHSGNRSVLVDHELSGLIVGLTLATRPEDIYRALIEATAFGTRVDHRGVRDGRRAGARVRRRRRAAQEPPAHADLRRRHCAVPLHLIDSEQGPALGSAIHAAVAAGAYPDVHAAAEAMGRCARDVYTPDEGAPRPTTSCTRDYRQLHDYFGRGGDDVMHRLRGIAAARRAVRVTPSCRRPARRCAALHAELLRYGLVAWTAGTCRRASPARS